MPQRSNRSARVVICDDVSWSEPTSQGRRSAVESDARDWNQREDADFRSSRGDADLEEARHELGEEPYEDDSRGEDAFDFDRARRVASSRTASRLGKHRRSEEHVRAARDAHDEPHRHDGVEADPARSGYRVEDYLGDAAEEWQAQAAGAAPVVDYTDVVDEEETWGPRPKLLAREDGGRRTVVITGRGADRYVAPRTGARESMPEHLRHGFSADRTAMWAVLLCVIVLLVAITSH